MSIDKLLLWEKWRPKKLEDLILLPRIKKHFENGLNGNYILHGHYGTGKTSLARILIGKYTKDKPFLEINSSLYTSIDVLRNDIETFCKFQPMMEVNSDIKYVFLDEFERVSVQFQDAFKAFIEKYSKNGVRFIITTNHINKISDGIKSRIPQLNFDCIDIEEEKYLKKEIFKRITNEILPSEGKEIPKEELVKIITKKFPDFRSTIVEVQNYLNTGHSSTSYSNVSNKIKLDLYRTIHDESLDYEKIYNFLMSSFGADKINVMIKLLGKPFIDWSLSEGKDVEKLFEVTHIVCEYDIILQSATDPVIVGMSLLGKLKKIFRT
jgi:DNA polymerase III delta prime subunit